jgi:uncharacterized protein (TIGR02466 family)|tara:strand:- start:28 stop:714 length:687 start_codon:yes stop_codon:yes gene_type:complete
METVRILGSLIGISKLNNFKEINTELIPVIEKDICNPEFRNKYYESHKTGYAFTSDKAGSLNSFEALYGDQLQLNKKFDKFFNSLQVNLNIFFNNLKYKNVDYFITKSWVAYTEKGEHISAHDHGASHFSFVYYVLKNNNHSSITFYEPNQRFYMPEATEWNDQNHQSILIKNEPGQLIIFPSSLKHGTQKTEESSPRISISGDIIMTSKVNTISEILIPNPNTWKKL